MRTKFTAIIFLNVLAGLLFSCGEGVRLLPFPNSEVAGKSQFQERNKIPYQPNVLRFDNGKAKYKTKNQRDDRQFFNSENAVKSEKCAVPVLEDFHAKSNLSEKTRFKSLLLLDSKSSRAPPFFS